MCKRFSKNLQAFVAADRAARPQLFRLFFFFPRFVSPASDQRGKNPRVPVRGSAGAGRHHEQLGNDACDGLHHPGAESPHRQCRLRREQGMICMMVRTFYLPAMKGSTARMIRCFEKLFGRGRMRCISLPSYCSDG